jgi:hypothetical protein
VGSKTATLGIVPCGWAVVASGTASKLRVNVTMHPTMLHHIVFSFCSHTSLLLVIDRKPNAGGEPRLAAGAKQERTL